MKAALTDSELLTGRALGETWTRENRSEADVEIPPALIITAPDGKTFTLGFKYQAGKSLDMEFNVLVDDRDSGEFASKIVMKGGTIAIYGSAGWRTWSGKSFI